MSIKNSLLPLLGGALLAATLTGITAVRAEPEKKAKCIVAGTEVTVTDKTNKVLIQGKPAYFCCDKCPVAFAKAPEKFVKNVGSCPIMGSAIAAPKAAERVVVNNGLWYFCCANCTDSVKNSPAALKAELEDVVSHKAFKASDASPRSDYKEQVYLFANAENKAAFDKEPAKYAVVFAR